MLFISFVVSKEPSCVYDVWLLNNEIDAIIQF